MSEKNTEIKEAIDSLDVDRARSLLRDALKEGNADTYYLASQVALSDDQRHEFLKRAVDSDPFHAKAIEELQKLKGSQKTSFASLSSSSYKSAIPNRTAEDNKHLSELEKKVQTLEATINFAEVKLQEAKNRMIAIGVLGLISLLLVLAVIGIIGLIIAALLYGNANKDIKQIEAQLLDLRKELIDARQELRDFQLQLGIT